MTSKEIIVELLQSKDINDYINKCNEAIQDDLRGELSLILLTTDPKRIETLKGNGNLDFYAITIISRLAHSKTSSFFYKHIRKPEPLVLENIIEFPELVEDTYHIILERDEKEQVEEMIFDTVEELGWYEREMIKIYLEAGTYRNVEKLTGIPISVVHRTIKKAGEQIIRKLLILNES